MADPEFPGAAVPIRELGAPTYYLAIFSPKTAWKWKKLDRGSLASLPLNQPMIITRWTYDCDFFRDDGAVGGEPERGPAEPSSPVPPQRKPVLHQLLPPVRLRLRPARVSSLKIHLRVDLTHLELLYVVSNWSIWLLKIYWDLWGATC